MLKKIIFGLTLCVTTTAAFADIEPANYGNNSSRAENTGILGGLTVGALAGGPPGAIVGAVVGGLLGDGFHLRGHAKDLERDLYESQLELAQLEEESQLMQNQYQLAQREIETLRENRARVMQTNLSLPNAKPCCDNAVLSLHFRSGSSKIENHYEEQLGSLVRLAKIMPTAVIEITGYADRNGDADTNLDLSRQRTGSIKEYFNRMGIQNSAITTVAYGETRPLNQAQDFEADFFDRRVIVRLRDSNAQMLTSSPDGE